MEIVDLPPPLDLERVRMRVTLSAQVALKVQVCDESSCPRVLLLDLERTPVLLFGALSLSEQVCDLEVSTCVIVYFLNV